MRNSHVRKEKVLAGVAAKSEKPAESRVDTDPNVSSKAEYGMSAVEIAKRCALFVVSLFISALGVAVTQKAELGVSPISSVANVMSIRLNFLTLGNWLIIWNLVLIAGQIVILRKKFQLIQLLQIPLSFLFGYFTDFWLWVIGSPELNGYLTRLAMVFVGTAVLALGVSLSVLANVIMNSGEAFVKALSDTTGPRFGNLKIAFDVVCVLSAVGLSLAFFDLSIVGTREGTVIAALTTGFFVNILPRLISKPVNMLIETKPAGHIS